MFDILFGWRKASKCKQLIKQVQCRLKLLKNKRATIVRLLRQDAAELIKNGYEDKVFNRVEQIFKDECVVTVYELLDNFCEFILLHLSYIRRHKDCPNDINEAVSSLIYASARCGDLPELRTIRKLFGERYGQKFEITALELFPGNLVNCQVIEKLSLKSVSDDMKHILVNEIARNYCIKPVILAIEYYSDWQDKVKEIGGHQAPDSGVRTYYEKSDMQIMKVEEVGGQDVYDSFGSNVVGLAGPTIMMHDEIETEEMDPPRDRKIVVYSDDIEEVETCTTRNRDDRPHDQRAFKFKATVSKREALENSNEWTESPGSRIVGRSLSGNGKRPRKRSVSLGNQLLKDSEYRSYYGRKHQKKMGGNILSCNVKENVGCEVPTLKQKRAISTRVGFADPSHEHKRLFGNRAMVYNVFTYPDHQPKMQSKEFKETLEEPGFQSNRASYSSSSSSLSSSSSSSPTVPSSWTRKEMAPLYFRNVTMPPERVKGNRNEEFQRSISDCFQYPTHVHPKLPDYVDIASKFTALKKERLQTKHH